MINQNTDIRDLAIIFWPEAQPSHFTVLAIPF